MCYNKRLQGIPGGAYIIGGEYHANTGIVLAATKRYQLIQSLLVILWNWLVLFGIGYGPLPPRPSILN
jgi:hypothetical protein